MILSHLIHPELIGALASAGHGSKVLLSDANYPNITGANPQAQRVWLNLAPGLLTVDQILEVLLTAVPFEAAEIMSPPEGIDVPAIDGYRTALDGIPFSGHERHDFYEQARSTDVAIVVATGDQRLFANLLLTIGVRAT
ncbi:RbsD/FucU family protein [soil metagenome]